MHLLNLDEYRRRRRQEGFRVSEVDSERNDAATRLFQKFQRCFFGPSALAEEEW